MCNASNKATVVFTSVILQYLEINTHIIIIAQQNQKRRLNVVFNIMNNIFFIAVDTFFLLRAQRDLS